MDAEIGRIRLAEALELTVLIARKEPRRQPRVAARWLLRYLEEHSETTIDEALLAASCLAAFRGFGLADAAHADRAANVQGRECATLEQPPDGALGDLQLGCRLTNGHPRRNNLLETVLTSPAPSCGKRTEWG